MAFFTFQGRNAVSQQLSAWEKLFTDMSPGAIGVRAVEAAEAKLGIAFSRMRKLYVTENDACGVDAVRF